MGFTDHDSNVVFGGVTYEAATGFTASAIKNTNSLAVDDSQVDGALSSAKITEADIDAKKYDYAMVSIYRVDYNAPTTKFVEVFTGYLGTLTRGKLSFMTELRSIAQLLNQPAGKSYTRTCRVDLFSSECGISVGSITNGLLTGKAVAAVFSRRMLTCTNGTLISLASGFFTGGLLTWTSGNNNGAKIEVKSHTLQVSGTVAWIELWESMPNAIQVGDQFSIQVGCDKTIETCLAKFNNVVNFRGFPRMPGQDIALQFASQKDRNDGTSWYS